MTAKHCTACGADIPAGRDVCEACEAELHAHPDDCEECLARRDPRRPIMTKQDLQQYQHLRRERDQIARLLEALECKMQDPRAAKLDDMPRSGTPDGSATERMVEQHDELLSRYRAKLDELDAAQLAIEQAVATLPHREATLIRAHYIEGKTWEQVCVEMAYSWRHVHRIHAAALQMLKNVREV